ncbi:MAG: DUF1178 family protein [Cohaesibacter sp.]|nr:DUF1178 family protein [Cohaesibacter sp.]
MIKFSLQCEAGHGFEGWFRNSDDFDSQKAQGFLQCPACGSEHISKALMAPAISGTRTQDKNHPSPQPSVPFEAVTDDNAKESVPPSQTPVPATIAQGSGEQSLAVQPDVSQQTDVIQKLRELRDKVVANSDYVGDKFADEARKMHFNETETRGIYGQATLQEVKELSEDGIDCLPLPILPEDRN